VFFFPHPYPYNRITRVTKTKTTTMLPTISEIAHHSSTTGELSSSAAGEEAVPVVETGSTAEHWVELTVPPKEAQHASVVR
jgi:hypothetical protein